LRCLAQPDSRYDSNFTEAESKERITPRIAVLLRLFSLAGAKKSPSLFGKGRDSFYLSASRWKI